ncbi:hypothetical protein PGSY75_1117900 [Plasmodium gaboni]|uniref:Uncharacterized protein n=1 Tax=Plasmodium gaboni TaxID=647221 RepID=A0A151LJ00_9APIC|nr:hypothetical protein PGSY75_1117900 [Plasmodium gaboni]KYN98819.1 hypothetical protein PGSY75_1117900 [Plasmodium gaboni]
MEKERKQFEVTRNSCTTSIKENLEYSTNIIKNVNNFILYPTLDNNYNYYNNILFDDYIYDKEGQHRNDMNYSGNTNNIYNINNNNLLLNKEYEKGMAYDKIIMNQKYCNTPIDTLHNNFQTNKLANVVNSIKFEDNTNIKIPVFLKNSPLDLLYPEFNSYIEQSLTKNDNEQQSEEYNMEGMKEQGMNTSTNVDNNIIYYNNIKNDNVISNDNNNNNNDNNNNHCYNNNFNNIEQTKNINNYLCNHVDNNTMIRNKMYDYFDNEKNNMIHISNVNDINNILLRNEQTNPADIIFNSYKNVYVSKNKKDDHINTEMNTLNVLKDQKMPILDHNDRDNLLSVEKNMRKKINVLNFEDNNSVNNNNNNIYAGGEDDSNNYTFDNYNFSDYPDYTHSTKLSKNPLFISFIDTTNKTAKLKTFDINNNKEVKTKQFFTPEKKKKGNFKDAQVQTNEEELKNYLTQNVVDSDVEHVLNIINKKTKKISENISTQENKQISSNNHTLNNNNNNNEDILLQNNQTHMHSSKYDISYNLIKPSSSDKSISNTTNNINGCNNNNNNSIIHTRNNRNNKNSQLQKCIIVSNNKCSMKQNIYTTNLQVSQYNFNTPLNINDDYINGIYRMNHENGNSNVYTHKKKNIYNNKKNNKNNNNNNNNNNNYNYNNNNNNNNNVYIKHHIKTQMNDPSEHILNNTNKCLSNISNNNYSYYPYKEQKIENIYPPFIYHMLNIPSYDRNINLSFLKKNHQNIEKRINEDSSNLKRDINKTNQSTYVKNNEHINNKVEVNEHEDEDKKSEIINNLLLKKLDIEKKKKIYEKWKYENYLKATLHLKRNNQLKYKNKEHFNILKNIYYNDQNNNIINPQIFNEHMTNNKNQHLLYSSISLNQTNNNILYSNEKQNNYNNGINEENSINYNKNTKLCISSNDHNTIFENSNKFLPQKYETNNLHSQDNNETRCRSLSYKNRLHKLILLKESIQQYKLISNTKNVLNTNPNNQIGNNNTHNHLLQYNHSISFQDDISNNINNLKNYEKENKNSNQSEYFLLNQKKQNTTNNQAQQQNNIKIKYNLKKQNILKQNYNDRNNSDLNYLENNNTIKNYVSTQISQEQNICNHPSNTFHNETIDNHIRNTTNYHMVGKPEAATSNNNKFVNNNNNNNQKKNNNNKKKKKKKKNINVKMNMNENNLLNNINITQNNNNSNNHLRIKASVKNPIEESTIHNIKNDKRTKHKSISNKRIFNKELLNKEKEILSDTEIEFRKKNSMDQLKENTPTDTSNTKNFLRKKNGSGGGNYLKIKPPFFKGTNTSTRSKSTNTNNVEKKNFEHDYLTSDYKVDLSMSDNIFEKTNDEINLENIDPNKWIQKIFGDIH